MAVRSQNQKRGSNKNDVHIGIESWSWQPWYLVRWVRQRYGGCQFWFRLGWLLMRFLGTCITEWNLSFSLQIWPAPLIVRPRHSSALLLDILGTLALPYHLACLKTHEPCKQECMFEVCTREHIDFNCLPVCNVNTLTSVVRCNNMLETRFRNITKISRLFIPSQSTKISVITCSPFITAEYWKLVLPIAKAFPSSHRDRFQ